MLPCNVHVAVDERQQIASVRARRVAQINDGNVVAVVLFSQSYRNFVRGLPWCRAPNSSCAGAGKPKLGYKKECRFTDTGRADHQAMHIVTVYQCIELLAALRAAEDQSLHLWQVLSSRHDVTSNGTFANVF